MSVNIEILPSNQSKENHVYDTLVAGDGLLWQPAYGEYSRDTQLARIDAIDSALRPVVGGDPQYVEALNQTVKFTEEIFGLYNGDEVVDHEGTFAFVVPSRMERKAPGEYDDYASEGNQHMPLLSYVDSSTRQIFVAGQSPFIIDKYGVDDEGRRGYMIFTPLLGDIMRDIADPNQMLQTVDKVINDTTDFAKQRLGVSVVGLGAILPRLTDMGKAIRTPELVTTTGHGGTVWLISETLREGYEKGLTRNGELGKVGIVGSGAIGSSTAELLLARDLTGSLIISDRNEDRLKSVVSRLSDSYPEASIEGTTDNIRVMDESDAVISAVTTQFNLNDESWKRANLDGLFLIDDSQPGAFNPEQFESRNGLLSWVMGHDGTPGGLMSLQGYDYVGTGPASKDDIFGCQAEAGAVYISGDHGAAINTEVTPGMALRIGKIFEQHNIRPAALQRLGEYIVPKITPVD